MILLNFKFKKNIENAGNAKNEKDAKNAENGPTAFQRLLLGFNKNNCMIIFYSTFLVLLKIVQFALNNTIQF